MYRSYCLLVSLVELSHHTRVVSSSNLLAGTISSETGRTIVRPFCFLAVSPAGLVLAIGASSSPEIQIDADRFARVLILVVSTKKKSRTRPKRRTKSMVIRHDENPARD